MTYHQSARNMPVVSQNAPQNEFHVNVAPIRSRLVCGVGRNDANYTLHTDRNIDGRKKRLWICPFYMVWKGMLERCYSAKCQARHPTYIGCSVVEDWLTFSTFRSWMEKQDCEGKHLDKDILIPGNKVYSPDTCTLITASLNKFVIGSDASRGAWPIGVFWNKGRGKFVAQCSNPVTGKRAHIGVFDCPDAAHEAWRARKHEHACAYADLQNDPRIAAALRSRYSPVSSEALEVLQ
jgi:hypothetical protein